MFLDRRYINIIFTTQCYKKFMIIHSRQSVIQYYSNDESSSIKLIYVVLAKDEMVMIYKRTAEDACSLQQHENIRRKELFQAVLSLCRLWSTVKIAESVSSVELCRNDTRRTELLLFTIATVSSVLHGCRH